jgi:uridine phosphorylase
MMPQIITGLREEEGARYALICGDPERVPKIAAMLEGHGKVRQVREFNIMEGRLEGERVLVASTGIGGPSTAILMEEMANTGTDTFIRVGTSGGIAEGLKKGDAVITTAVYRKDGTSRSYVPDSFPAAAHPDIVRYLQDAAEQLGLRYQVGVTMSVDGFYSENRVISNGKMGSMAHNGFMLSSRENDLLDAKRMNVKNIEMEMGTVLTLTTLWGIRGGGICLVSDIAPWHPTEDLIDPEKGMQSCISAAVHALRLVIKKDRD